MKCKLWMCGILLVVCMMSSCGINRSNENYVSSTSVEKTFPSYDILVPRRLGMEVGENRTLQLKQQKIVHVQAVDDCVQVQDDGTIIAIKEGVTTITATGESGKKFTCPVWVQQSKKSRKKMKKVVLLGSQFQSKRESKKIYEKRC